MRWIVSHPQRSLNGDSRTMTHDQAPPPDPSRQSDSMNAAPHPSEITDLPRRLAFLDIDDADRQRLRELAPQLKPSAAAFVETFYRHLFAFEETARFLHEPALGRAAQAVATIAPGIDAGSRMERSLRSAALPRG